jgi:hypothetical protein
MSFHKATHQIGPKAAAHAMNMGPQIPSRKGRARQSTPAKPAQRENFPPFLSKIC